jgi:RNA polymerase sigma-70 factor (ECF subfamily)
LDFQVFDADYVSRLREGDPEVERHFTAHFGHLLEIKLRARLRAPQLVGDARQETFLRVFSTLRNPEKRQPENLGAFVNAVCNNVLFELFRAESRTLAMTESTPEPTDPGVDPEGQAVSADRKRLVHQVLGELPSRDCQLLREVFLEERDKDEVCRDHDIDREYLRVLLHRAKIRFRGLLAPAAKGAVAGAQPTEMKRSSGLESHPR